MDEQEKLVKLHHDLTLWIVKNLNMPAKTQFSFWQDFRDGLILCHLIEKFGFPCPHQRKPSEPQSEANSLKLCQDNLTSFLTSCERHLKLPSSVIFQPEDLLESQNERRVGICMYHVMKRSRKYGLKVPKLTAVFPPISDLRINTGYAPASLIMSLDFSNPTSPDEPQASCEDTLEGPPCKVLYSCEPSKVTADGELILTAPLSFPVANPTSAPAATTTAAAGKLCSIGGEMLTWDYWTSLPQVQATVDALDRLITFLFSNKIRTVPCQFEPKEKPNDFF